jgi:hypothetical protein
MHRWFGMLQEHGYMMRQQQWRSYTEASLAANLKVQVTHEYASNHVLPHQHQQRQLSDTAARWTQLNEAEAATTAKVASAAAHSRTCRLLLPRSAGIGCQALPGIHQLRSVLLGVILGVAHVVQVWVPLSLQAEALAPLQQQANTTGGQLSAGLG